MKFIKRFIFVLILLLIAFFIYRLINPTAAKELLFDLKTFSNDKIGTHFSLSGEIIETWAVLNVTGTVSEDMWFLQEISGDEQLLLNDAELTQESFTETWTSSVATAVVAPAPTPLPTPTPTPKTTTVKTTTPTTKTTSSSSSKNTSDLNAFLKKFGN